MSRNERLALVNRDDPMPVAQQCRLLDLSRRAAYHFGVAPAHPQKP